MPENFFITTAIDYTNAAPHVGHSYEKILADVLARYHRLKGDNVFFLTGVDQHGQKVQQAAADKGVEPQEFVDGLTEKFTALWQKINISYDGWAATTQPSHKDCVRQILQNLFKAGEIYQAKYKGFYSVRQEQFLTDKERGPDGNFGAEWGEVTELEETNWYFKLTKYKDWLVEFIDRTPGLVVPGYRQVELRNAAAKMEGDLSISRPKARLSWGIELPFDLECVTYVWFDALVNYISFAGFKPDAKNPQAAIANPQFHWPQLHVIGKDIIIPAHGVYWLCMLKAMGFTDAQMPKFLVHGYIMVDGEKSSKSLGNVLDPNVYADTFGAEALRYHLMRDCAVGSDMDFIDSRLIQRYNSDLAGNLGNLLNRTLSMAHKYREGRLAAAPANLGGEGLQSGLGDLSVTHVAMYREHMDGVHILPQGERKDPVPHQISAALDDTMQFATLCNQLIEQEKPWALAKDPVNAARLDAVLYHLAESLRIIAILIAPTLPKASAGILEQLQVSGPPRLEDTKWGGLADGHVLGKPTPVFPRIEAAVSG